MIPSFKWFGVFYENATTLLYTLSIDCQVSVIFKGVHSHYGFDYLLRFHFHEWAFQFTNLFSKHSNEFQKVLIGL